MPKIFKIAASIGIGLAVCLLVALSVLYHLIQSGELRDFALSEIENQTGLQVEVGETNLSIGTAIGISFADFSLLDPAGARPVMTAQKVVARVALLPLLGRKAVFSELRLDRPALQIHRNQQGQIPQFDLLLKLLFKEREGRRFAFDLRGIRIEEGEIRFVDYYKTRDPAVTRLRRMQLTLQRGNGWARADGISPETPVAPELDGSGRDVEFRFAAAIEKGGKTSGLKSQGKAAFPAGSFDLLQARWDAKIQLEGFPTSGLWDYYRHAFPIKTVTGVVSTRLTWQGRLADRVQIQGETTFQELSLDAPELFPQRVSLGDGRFEFAADRSPQEIRISRLAMRSSKLSLSLRARAHSLGEEDPHLEIQLATPFVPVAGIRQFIPLRVLSSARLASWVGALNQGEVKVTKAGFSGRLSQIRGFSERGLDDHLWLDAEVRGAGLEPKGDGYFPLRDVNGRLVLEKGVLHYKGFRGSYGLSRFTEVEGTHKGVLTDQAILDLRLRGDVDLGQMREQLRPALSSPSMKKAVGMVQELEGRAQLTLSLHTDGASHRYEGRLAPENGGARAGDLSFSQIKGEVIFSEREIRAERLSALLAGSPLAARALLNNYLTDQSTFDLTVESPGLRAGALSPFLPSLVSPQDTGWVRGALRYQGPLASASGRELSGSLELVGMQLQKGVFGHSMRDLSGRIKLDKSVIDFQPLRGRISGYPFDVSGQWRHADKPQVTFNLVSPAMDIARVLPKGVGGSLEWYDRLQAKGKVNIVSGNYEGFEFTGLKTDLTIDNRQWRLDNFSARSHGGSVQGAALFIDHPVGITFSMQPNVEEVPIEGFLKWFDAGTAEVTGRVNLTGTFDSTGTNRLERKKNLKGEFKLRLEDGVLRRLTVLARILNLLDLSRWFTLKMPDLSQKGIRFRSVTGDFKIEKGVYATQNLFVDSDDLRLTGAGTLDGVTSEVDFVIAVRPFPGLDTAVNFIPLLGPGIAAIKNSLLVASFRVRGPIDDPKIAPAPLSTLSEFFFSALAIPKGIIRGSGQEQK